EAGVPEKELLPIKVEPRQGQGEVLVHEAFSMHQDFIKKLARISSMDFYKAEEMKEEFVLAQFTGSLVHELSFDVMFIYKHTIDIPAERERLTKDIAKYEKGLAFAERQLSNESFLAKAPPEVVEGLKKQEAETRLLLEKARAALGALPKD
ncbi:MAG: valine--tRNA ligase, partial [Terracidiphilus sp.]